MALYLFSNNFGSPELSQSITTYFIELTDSPGSLPTSLPTFGSYEQRLLEPPIVSEIITGGNFGLRNFGSTNIRLNNSDSLFNINSNLWSYTIRVWRQLVLTRELIYLGLVKSFSIGIEMILNAEDQNSEIYKTLLPKRIINTTDFPNATDFQPIQIAFGLVSGHPAWYIDFDHQNRNYYYMLGEGLGNDGNGWVETFQVYSDDAVMEDTEGSFQNTGSDWIELDAQDEKPDSWYQYFWVSIEDSGGNELEIHPVTSYITNKAYITPETFDNLIPFAFPFGLPVLDNFNRANQGPPPGPGWTSFTGQAGLVVVSNALKANILPSAGAYWNTIYNADQSIYFDITTLGAANDEIQIYLRAKTSPAIPTDAYKIKLTFLSGNDEILIRKEVTSITTNLGAVDTSQNFVAGDGFGVRVQGTTISVWRRSSGIWTQITTRTDSDLTATGKIAIRITETVSNTIVLDNLGGGNIPPETYRLREWRFYNGEQVSPFPTYALLHFKKQLVNQGRFRTITVDANAWQAEKTILGLLRGLLENATWGLGQVIDNTIWTSESALQPPITLGGALTTQQEAIDITSEIQKLWGVKLYSTSNGIAVWIDKTQNVIANYGHADGYYNNVLKGSFNGVESIDTTEIIKNLNIRFRFNRRKNEYLMSYSRVVNIIGVDRPLDLAYVFDTVSADRIASRIEKVSENTKRFIHFNGFKEVLDLGDVISFIAPKHGISNNTNFKIKELSEGRDSLGIKADTYVDTTSYVPGTLPNDPNGDSTSIEQIVADFSTTIPNPVTGLVVTAFTRVTEEGIIESFFKVRFTPPEDNYSDSIIQIKLSSEALTEYRQVARVIDYAEIKAISKGTNHDIQVIPYNAAGTLSGAVSQALNKVSAGDTLLPKVPTGLAGSAGKDTLEWMWSAVTQNTDNSALINLLGYLYEITNLSGSVIYVPLTLTSSIKVPYLANTGDLTAFITRYLRVAAKKQNSLIGAYTTRVLATTKQINTADIGTSQITNPLILNNDVTNKKVVSNTATTNSSPLLSTTFTVMGGRPVMIWFRATALGSAGMIITVRRDSTNLFVDVAPGPYTGTIEIKYIDTNPPAGTRTYDIPCGNIPAAGINNRILMLEELKV